MPLAWLNESAVIDQATADQIYSQLVSVIRTVTYISWAVLVLGVLLVAAAVIGFVATTIQASKRVHSLLAFRLMTTMKKASYTEAQRGQSALSVS